MGYQALARKYRPVRFSDLVGQEVVARALQNALELDRLPRAVIFSGVRGIGKTTTARLYAKLLNCENHVNIADEGVKQLEPCGQCASCVATAEGRHEDVLEIDGASHTGVDDVRALQETLAYVPQRSAYKVYIIDEVHMLSQSAFNALLKTLEEPPAHVVFIFATTELQKVPETILSRCQTFHLRRLSMAQIMERLREILEAEKLSYEPRALAIVAKEGRGSVRDALTFLDQVIAVGAGSVSMEALETIIKGVSSKPYIQMLEALLAKDAQKIVAMTTNWDEQGVLFADICENLAKMARHAFILKDLGKESLDVSLAGLDPDEMSQIEAMGHKAQVLELNRLFRNLVHCRRDLDGSSMDRFIFENYMMEWCFDPGLPDLGDLKKILQNPQAVKASAPRATQQPSHPSQPPSTQARQSAAGTPAVENRAKKENRGLSLQDRLNREVVNPAQSEAAKDVQQSKPELSLAKEPEVAPATISKSEPEQQDQSPATAPATPKNETSQVLKSLKTLKEQQSAPKPAAPQPKEEKPSVVASEPKPAENQELLGASAKPFPKDWRDLVEQWKAEKPLQARLLEETFATQYGPDHIQIQVSGSAMAASQLAKAEVQSHIEAEFKKLFSFRGRLQIQIENQSDEKPETTRELNLAQPTRSNAEDSKLPEKKETNEKLSSARTQETILEARTREQKQEREDFKKELLNHPITKEALTVFNGKIKDVVFDDY